MMPPTNAHAPRERLSGAVARFKANERGRDFVVGDIHGMFSHLRALLDSLEFDGDCDRIFSVGDLIDRGPESRAAVTWLDYPWFHAVRGNHEQFALDSDDPEQLEVWLTYNGGRWWMELSADERHRTKARFAAIPIAIEVETAAGTIGIVHADVPPFVTWDRFVELVELGDRDALYHATWSRNRIQGSYSDATVHGRVDRIYCGHTPVSDVMDVGNVHFIDTGAVYSLDGYAEARLTLVEIHPGPHRVRDITTNQRVWTPGTVATTSRGR